MDTHPLEALEPRRLLAGAPVVELMTYNVSYGGGSSLSAIASAFTDLWDNVESSRIPERAETIAQEIRRQRPDLVALQEAVIWRTGEALDDDPAEDVEFDFAAEIMRYLRSGRGRYRLVSSVTNADWEVPVQVGSSIRDVRMTDRDVILARVGSRSPIKVLSADHGNYRDSFSFDIPVIDREIDFVRGWASVDVRHRESRQRFRFITTHLEVFDAAVQRSQARELLDGPADTPRRFPVILAGDFNTDADAQTLTYRLFLDAGFEDAWGESRGAGGDTCCHDDDLRGDSSLESRVDLILFRGRRTRARSADLFGDDEADRTPSGLWPSDHAAVFSRVRIAERT